MLNWQWSNQHSERRESTPLIIMQSLYLPSSQQKTQQPKLHNHCSFHHSSCQLLEQHQWISQNRLCVGSTRSFRVMWTEMGWSWSGMIRNSKGMVGWDRHVTPNMVEYPKRTQLGGSLSLYPMSKGLQCGHDIGRKSHSVTLKVSLNDCHVLVSSRYTTRPRVGWFHWDVVKSDKCQVRV